VFVDYRVFYTKTGRLKYISHLDVNRLMQRALKRSGLPVWYSEGFNPHIYLTFALPLALGVESVYEVMDFRLVAFLSEKEITRRIQSALPEGMTVLSVSRPVDKVQEIASAEFEIAFSSCSASDLLEKWNAFLAKDEICVEKRTKKGIKTINIKPEITVKCAAVEAERFLLTLLLPAGIEKNISPFLVLEAFEAFVSSDKLFADIKKIGVFTKDGRQFR